MSRRMPPWVLLLPFVGLASISCATTGDGMSRDDARRARACRMGETYTCIERMRKPVRCFCADRDRLRELLEPTS